MTRGVICATKNTTRKHSTTFPVSVSHPCPAPLRPSCSTAPFSDFRHHGSVAVDKSDSVRVRMAPGNGQPQQRSQYHAIAKWNGVPTHGLHADDLEFEITGSQTGGRCTFLVQRRGSGMLTRGKAELGAGRWTLCHRRYIACFCACTRECSRPVSISRGSLIHEYTGSRWEYSDVVKWLGNATLDGGLFSLVQNGLEAVLHAAEGSVYVKTGPTFDARR